MNKFVRFTAIALSAVVILGLAGFLYLRSSLPQVDGEIILQGLSAPVTIVRDANAVPHIKAETEADMHFALGFVHAQDRLWQMEMNRRLAQGRLAEILGAEALPNDKFLRTLSLFDRAKKAYAGIDDNTRMVLEAYAAGVNAYLETRTGALPPEFILTGSEPAPWTPLDTMGWYKVMAWDLGGNWQWELGRLRLLAKLSPERIDEFYPPLRGETRAPLPDPADIYGPEYANAILSGKSAGLFTVEEPAEGLGSNNWVIGGSRTETGKPLLANDPHLRFGAPSIWYLAHMSVGGKNIIGVSFPGAPNIILGRNDNAAWGFTNTGPDVQDLFLERRSRENPDNYETPDGSAPFVTRVEIINVKDAEPVAIAVRETRHGPVISDVLTGLNGVLPEDHVLAMRWTALENDDATPSSASNWMNVSSWGDMPDAVRQFSVPQQNIVFADTTGNIGYIAPARIPVRGDANLTRGLMPAPGWDADYDWNAYIPFEELPRIANPEKGYVATANSKIVSDDYPHFISSNWALPYRTWRINERIEATEKHSIESMRDLHMDDFSNMANDFVPLMTPSVAETHADIAALLGDWDRHMARDRAAPLIYMAWHRHMAWAIYGDELGDDLKGFWRLRAEFLYNVLTDRNGQSRWCDNVTTDTPETCSDVLRSSLASALEELTATYGPDRGAWRWDMAHQARHAHRPMSNVPWLRDFFDGVIAVPGGPYTVNVTMVTANSSTPYEAHHGASYRAIYDLADLDNSRFIIPMGQSGNPFSPFYRDQLEKWRDGEYIRIPSDFDAAGDGALGTLTLTPAE